MLAPTLMVQGTASSVGKSLLTAALCRLFHQRGLRVAPFKAQNMALNSFVTPDGAEIGRAQAVQAAAAGIEPTAHMNPILLKPEGEARSQVVVLGRPVGRMGAAAYHEHKPRLRAIVAECVQHLRRNYDLVIMEGAGSPAEINLKQHDIVNMDVARRFDTPVLLVGDIDRGGVFAAFVGTLALLEPDEQRLVAGFLINKFRGDLALLAPGLAFLRDRTGIPVLGVVPYIDRLRVADEDSVALEARMGRQRPGANALDIAVVRLPRISNHDDVEALEHEPGVVVRFVEDADALDNADLVIVPGTKCTVADLNWLRERGIADVVVQRARAGAPVLGICGGLQMLGRRIVDPQHVESQTPVAAGLGLLPIETVFAADKITAQVRARARVGSFLAQPGHAAELRGYEIHMGRVAYLQAAAVPCAPFAIVQRNRKAVEVLDGALSSDGVVVGTMIHGLLENAAVRKSLLDFLRQRKGLTATDATIPSREAGYDRLAAVVGEHCDIAQIARIAGIDVT